MSINRVSSAGSIFEVVVVCNTIHDAYWAFNVCNLVSQKLGPESRLELKLWHFMAMQDTALVESATEEAREASMVIIATRANQELPPEVKDWVGDWTAKRSEKPGALVALLGSEAPVGEGDSHRFLKAAAARARMDFFASNRNLNDLLSHQPLMGVPYLHRSGEEGDLLELDRSAVGNAGLAHEPRTTDPRT